jgi:hypothetical protein
LAVDLAPTPSADGVSPAAVLHPAFEAAREHGYLTGDDGQLELTEVGQREIDKLVGATHRWLVDELTDWGAADDELLTRALDNMANRFIDQDPQLLPAPEVPVAIGGAARTPEPPRRTPGLNRLSVAVTPVAELLDQSGMGWMPIELSSSLGSGRALIEQQDLGEVLA